jgi:hypothetical protein
VVTLHGKIDESDFAEKLAAMFRENAGADIMSAMGRL